MSRVPFDPHVNSQPNLSVPEVRVAVDAAGKVNKAWGQAGADTYKAVSAGVEWQKQRVEAAYQADMIAGGQMYKTLSMQRDKELSEIPVTNGVDYDRQADSIRHKYSDQWKTWMRDNVRNQKHAYVQGNVDLSGQEFDSESDYSVALGRARYDRSFDLSQLDIGLRTAIDTDDEGAISQNMAARVHQGFMTQAEADALGEKSNKEKDALWDRSARARMGIALADGNLDAYDAEVDQLREVTLDQKRELKRTGKSTLAYNVANEIFSEARTLENLEGLRGMLDSGKVGKNMTYSQKANMSAQINGRMRQIHRSHQINRAGLLREASRGVYNSAAVDKMSINDGPEGIGLENVDAFKQTLIDAVESYNRAETTKAVLDQARKTDDYKDLSDDLAKDLISPEGFNLNNRLKQIDSKDLHPVVKAEMMSKVLEIEAMNIEATDEVKHADWTAMNLIPIYTAFDLMKADRRKVGDEEKELLKEYLEGWRMLSDQGGVFPDNLSELMKADMKKVRDAYDNPDKMDLDALRSEIGISPAAEVTRDRLRRSNGIQ